MDDVQFPYFKRRLVRAFQETITPIGLNLRTAIYAVELGIVGLVYVWLVAGENEAWLRLKYSLAAVSAFGTVFCLNFLWNYMAAPARMQREADARGDALELELDHIRNKQKHVDVLSELLSDAIHNIWNRPITSEPELSSLDVYWQDWQVRVRTELEAHFTQSDIIHFCRLGVVPLVTRDDTFSPQHKKILREYALKEDRLRQIIRDYNGRSWSQSKA